MWIPIWAQQQARPDEQAVQQALHHMPHADIPECPPDLALWMQAVKGL